MMTLYITEYYRRSIGSSLEPRLTVRATALTGNKSAFRVFISPVNYNVADSYVCYWCYTFVVGLLPSVFFNQLYSLNI